MRHQTKHHHQDVHAPSWSKNAVARLLWISLTIALVLIQLPALLKPIDSAATNSASQRSKEHAVPRQNHIPPQRQPLVGHLIPHSHCDAAYKKTLDEYYETQVRHILSSMVEALRQHLHRRFVWAETVFLTMWWKDLRTSTQERRDFMDLVTMGRIELVNGGWVMHDEAITRYDAQIHQMTLGHQQLARLFASPTIQNTMTKTATIFPPPSFNITTGWQIDPFGPSSFTATTLHAQAGIFFLVTNRIATDLKEELKANRSLQFYWEPATTSRDKRVLVHVLDTHYETPVGFDWESLEHGSAPITKANVMAQSDAYMQLLREKGSWYRTPHILLPFGGDFRFYNASSQFTNMEQIVQFVQDHPDRYQGDSLRFSTVQEYQTTLFMEQEEHDDTFPIITGSPFLNYWTGYYTQLPMLKQMVRTCEILLRTLEVSAVVRRLQRRSKFADATSIFRSNWWNSTTRSTTRTRHHHHHEQIQSFRELVALMQHHDALPATSYRFVLADYMKRLTKGFHSMSRLLSDLSTTLLGCASHDSGNPCHSQDLSSENIKDDNEEVLAPIIVGGGVYLHETSLVRGAGSNARTISLDQVVDPTMGGKGIALAVFNSLSWNRDMLVHFVCTRSDVALVRVHPDGRRESIQMVQATPLEHEIDTANLGLFLISFHAHVPALGRSDFVLSVCDLSWTTDQHPPPTIPSLVCAKIAQTMTVEDLVNHGLTSETLQVEFNATTLDLLAIRKRSNGASDESLRIDLTHDFVLYDGQNDTIYEMNTGIPDSHPPPLLGSRTSRHFVVGYRGPLFSQVLLEFKPWLRVRYRLATTAIINEPGSSLLQISVFSGPVPPNVNLASRLSSRRLANARWYYDENGFQPVATSYDDTKQVGRNLRPLVSRTWLEGDNVTLTIHSVDPRGVVTHGYGDLDVFWQRRNNSTSAWWKNDSHAIDWWKQGEDLSSCVSSIWIDLDSPFATAGSGKLSSRRVAAELANDAVLLKIHATPSSAVPPLDSYCLPDHMHLVTFAQSGDDDNIWLDVQIENLCELADRCDRQINLAEFLTRSVDGATLYTLTYLHELNEATKLTSMFDGTSQVNIDYDSCLLETTSSDTVILTVPPRMICSLRARLPEQLEY